MKCEIIRDLLPSYIDGLTSTESNEMIEEHLQECAECREYLSDMRASIGTENQKAGKNIQPFLKIKRETIKKIVIACMLTACVCAVGIESLENYFYGGKSVTSEEVKIDLENQYGITCLQFINQEENRVINVGYTENKPVDGKMPVATLNLVSRHYYSLTEFPSENEYRLYFVDDDTVVDLYAIPNEMDFDEDDFFAIYFDDGMKTIKLSDLRDGNIESLK